MSDRLEPACGSDRHMVPEKRPANSLLREHLASAAACRAPSAGWRCRWSACRRRRRRCRPWRRSCWPPSRPRRAAACRRSRSPAPRRACRTRHRPAPPRALACGRCTFSPSNRGSSVSARRLNGANFSRAMRLAGVEHRVEGLAAVVGEARRARCSDSTLSQSYSRKSSGLAVAHGVSRWLWRRTAARSCPAPSRRASRRAA